MDGLELLKRNALLVGILGVLVFIHLIQLGSDDGLAAFQTYPDRIRRAWQFMRAGEWSWTNQSVLITLLSGAMLHADPGHLFGNLIFLWIFGGLVRELLGNRWLLVIFLFTGIGGAIGDVLLRQGSPVPSLGASGAVMGLEGAYLGLAVRWRLPDPYIWPMSHPVPPVHLAVLAVMSFLLDARGAGLGFGGIAFGAHLGGFIVGLFLTSFIAPRPRTI